MPDPEADNFYDTSSDQTGGGTAYKGSWADLFADQKNLDTSAATANY